MTALELSKLTGIKKITVDYLLKKASRFNQQMKAKLSYSRQAYVANFTLEEIELALSFYSKTTPLLISFIKENFVKRDVNFLTKNKPINLTKEQKTFLKKYKQNKEIKCCNTCSFCFPRTTLRPGSSLRPYCCLHEKFLTFAKVNVYEDKCDKWKKTDRNPVLWLKRGNPVNVNISFEKKEDSIIGYDPCQIKDIKRKPNEPIILLK